MNRLELMEWAVGYSFAVSPCLALAQGDPPSLLPLQGYSKGMETWTPFYAGIRDCIDVAILAHRHGTLDSLPRQFAHPSELDAWANWARLRSRRFGSDPVK